jgi:hypothetical protein
MEHVASRLRRIVAQLVVLAGPVVLHAQGSPAQVATPAGGVTVQPRVMVIPFTRKDEDIRTVLEADFTKRVALARVRAAFDQRGFTTADFLASVRAVGEASAVRLTDQQSIKTAIVENSRADVYVEVEFNTNQSGNLMSSTVILTAYESSTANSLANRVGRSPMSQLTDPEQHVDRALADMLDPFLDAMNEKWQAMVVAGKSIVLDISLASGARSSFATPVGTSRLPLSDAIEEWLGTNAWRGYYHLAGTTNQRMIADDVRIPVRDPVTNLNFSASNFASRFVQYLRSVGVTATRTVRSNTIYVELR